MTPRATSCRLFAPMCAIVWTGLALFGSLVAPTEALAQPASGGAGTGGRFELSGGVGWTGGWDLGSAPATLTGNGVPTGTPVTLFETETRVDGGPRFEGRLAWYLTPVIAIEGGLVVTRTYLRTDVRNDFEQAPPITASERFTEYAIEGALVVQVPAWRFAGGRARPFVTGGAGHLRQAHEGSTRIDTGQIVFAGGGATLVLRQAGRSAFLETLGLRGTARLDVRSGGFEREPAAGADSGPGSGSGGGTRVGPSVSATVFVRF